MDLTIIIPTTNFRGSLVSRALDYYRSFKINVIIVDNSKKKQNFKLNKDEKYFHLFNKDFIERIIFGIKKTKSKYIAVCQDDDFLNITSLDKGVKFLDNNNDFSIVNGVDIYFENFCNKFILSRVYKIDAYGTSSSKGLFNRFKQISHFKTQMTASLFRKKHLLISLTNFKKLQLNKKNKLKFYDELAFSLFPVLNGRHKFINEIWQVRDRSVYPYTQKKNNSNISRPIQTISIEEFLKFPDTVKLKSYFYSHISRNNKKLSFNKFEFFFNSLYQSRVKLKNQNTLDFIKKLSKKNFSFLFKVLSLLKKIIRILFLESDKLIDLRKKRLFINNDWQVLLGCLLKFQKKTEKIDLS
jgi:glycosyltransferase domain-containing protein